jgi:polyisoprenoid-binding protein YceI
MKRIIIAILAMGVLTVSHAQTFNADPTQSKIKWHGSKVTGEHFGFINLKSGKLMMDNGQVKGGEFIVDMTSMTNTDIESEKYNQKLIGHLKSDDFFGVNTFPEATLKIKSAKVSTEEGSTHSFKGDITIKGKTEEITFPANVKFEGDKMMATAKITIDRSKFDVKYGSGSFFEGLGDNLIYDDFDLEINLVASK